MDYTSKRWHRLRQKILKRDNYICQYNKRFGRLVEANTVHHIYPAETYPQYEYCEWNLISLSKEAHNIMHDRDSHELTDEGLKLQERLKRKLQNDKRNNTILER